MTLSKIIRGNQAEEAKRWSIPSVDQPDQSVTREYNEGFSSVCAQIPTEKQLEQFKKQAYDEAFQKGLADGQQRAQADFQALLSVANELLNQLSEPIDFIDKQVREQLVALSMAISKQIIKAELKQKAEFILKLVNQAITVLPDSPSAIYVHLNPGDAVEIKEKLEKEDKHPNWTVVNDPTIESGGCKVFTDSTSVDLSLDAQIARVATKFLEMDNDDDFDPDQMSI